MRDRVVTVLGGSGFIGRHVVRRLALRGATIRVPTRHPEQAFFLKPMAEIGQIALTEWSARDPSSLEPALDGATDVINLIGILFERRRGEFQSLQAELPGKIGALAAGAGLGRVVHLSAIGADPGGRSVYARTKAAGEAALRGAFADATIMRPSIVFGPEDAFFNKFARMTQISPALPLIGGGTTRFQPVFVGDVAEAVVAALAEPGTKGRTYELAGPRVYTFRELMEYLVGVLGRRRFLLNLPLKLAAQQARLLQYLPEPPLTPDQVELLRHDNVPGGECPGLQALGIEPTALEVIVPTYVRAFAREPMRVPTA